MGFIRRTLFTLLLLGAVFAFRGWIYRHLVSYKSIGQRDGYAAKSELVRYIEENGGDQKKRGVTDIIRLSLSASSDRLKFTVDSADYDPNKLIGSGKANCIGYAAFFSTVCNHLFKMHGLDSAWSAKSQVGQLHLFGQNIHSIFSSKFLADHDFVTIENRSTGEVLAVDPTIYDFLLIDFVSSEK